MILLSIEEKQNIAIRSYFHNLEEYTCDNKKFKSAMPPISSERVFQVSLEALEKIASGFKASCDENKEEQMAFIRNDLVKAKNIEDLERRIVKQSEKNQLFLQKMLKEVNEDLERRIRKREIQNEIE